MLQFEPKRFFTRQCFFSFRCCFVAILKSSADTNVGQNRKLTHCTKSRYRYNLSLSIFKRSLLFVRQSPTNTISLPLIHSISSKHVFTAASDFGNRKKIISNLTLQVQFSPPRLGKGQFLTPETALSVKFPTPWGTENSQMPAVWGGEGRLLKFRFYRRTIIQKDLKHDYLSSVN